MSLRPDRRNALYAILATAVLLLNGYIAYITTHSVVIILSRPTKPIFTIVGLLSLWACVSVYTPVIALRRMHRQRIHIAGRRSSFLALFRLRAPFGRASAEAGRAGRAVARAIEAADGYARGEVLAWADVAVLDEGARHWVRALVEETVNVKRTGGDDEDAPTALVETSAWVLMLAHGLLCTTIMLALRFAAIEVAAGAARATDVEMGKVVTEWLSNYTLLLVGVLQLVTAGDWSCAFTGRCHGPTAAITPRQTRAVVTLYVAMADAPVQGLRREGAPYARAQMCGAVWKAPRANTALLAALGDRFDFDAHECGDACSTLAGFRWLTAVNGDDAEAGAFSLEEMTEAPKGIDDVFTVCTVGS